ncbi:MAG TPA: hypothetical protein VFB82_01920, partial [Blastocatellia bacterium]|nr:hypothetical protein [Blastocatellia bacterium]
MTSESAIDQKTERALGRLLRYCREEEWAGYDPYDGLNSPVLKALTLNNKTLRTFATQLIKHSPVNIRPLVGIAKGLNPKGLALAARALVLLLRGKSRDPAGTGERELLEADVRQLLTKLGELRNSSYKEACWGYNFDWQSRAFYAPRGTPNVVCTVFAAQAYLDWYDATGDELAFE